MTGLYTGERPINFTTREVLRVHLEDINTTENIADWSPSTLLASIWVGRHSFGDIHTVSVERPEYKRLRHGTVSEFKIAIRDNTGKLIDNHQLPVHLTLAFTVCV